MTDGASQRAATVKAVIWWVIIGAVVLIPLMVVPSAKDAFRVPKELAFRAAGILIVMLVTIAGWRSFADRKWKTEFVLVSAICGWAIIPTLFSVHRGLSLQALATIFIGSIVFLAVCVTGETRAPRAIWWPLLPALVNGVILLAQALAIWSPFGATAMETALLGNRNDAGAYMLAPAIASFVLAAITSGREGILNGVVATILFAALLASQTISAIVAYVVALIVFCIIADRNPAKRGLLFVGVMFVAATLLGLANRSAVRVMIPRFEAKASAFLHGDLDMLASSRIGPFLTALQMFMDRPVTGVGPGAFHYEYFSHRIAAERRYPTLVSPKAERTNFGEVHNDHLQVLAETGLIGYLLGLMSIAHIGSLSRPRRNPGIPIARRAILARHLALPLMSGLVVLAVGQFPLELAAPRLTFIFVAALCCAWSRA